MQGSARKGYHRIMGQQKDQKAKASRGGVNPDDIYLLSLAGLTMARSPGVISDFLKWGVCRGHPFLSFRFSSLPIYIMHVMR